MTPTDPGPNPASAPAARWGVGIVALLALVAVAGHGAGRPSPDVAWNLYVTRRLMEGATLGVDVLENSPPMIFLLKVPAVAVADLGGWREWPVWVALVAALAIAAVALSVLQVSRVQGQPAVSGSWWTVLMVLALVVVPGGDFGQRDHLTAILILPFVMLVARRCGGGTASPLVAVLVGVMAAAGIGIKPHFVVFPVTLWLVLARSRGRRAILTPENTTVCLVGAAYVTSVALVYPGYFTYAATYGALYQRFQTDFLLIGGAVLQLPSWAQAALWPGAIPAFIGLGGYAAMRTTVSAGARPTAAVLATATGALLFAALVQGKGWWYHFLPATTTATLLIAVLLASAAGRRLRAAAQLYRVTGAATTFFLIAAALPDIFLRVAHRGSPRLDADRNFPRLLPLVTAAGQVAVLSTNITSGFPLVLESRSRWALRYPSLWPLVAFYEDQVPGTTLIKVRDYPARQGLERQFTQDVVDDLMRTKPSLILVLRPDSNTTRWGGARRFDYLGYFGTHPTFRDSVFRSYSAAGSVGDYDVYERRTGSARSDETSGGHRGDQR